MNEDKLKSEPKGFEGWFNNLKLSVSSDVRRLALRLKTLGNTFRDRWNGFAYWIRFNMAKLGKFLKRIGRKLRHPRTNAMYQVRIMMMSVNGISTRFRPKRKSVLMTTNFDSTRFTGDTVDEPVHEVYVPKLVHNTSKRSQVVLVVCLLVAVLCVGYIYIMFVSKLANTPASLDLSSESLTDRNKQIYIDAQLAKQDLAPLSNSQFPQLINSPLVFNWSPGVFPVGRKNIITASIDDDGDWDVSVVCNKCGTDKKYEWIPFYRGIIRNYNKSAEFGGTSVYTPNTKPLSSSSNIEDWMSQNVATNSSLMILDNSFPTYKFENTEIDYKENTDTEITSTLRGPHTFLLYLKDSFQLEVHKSDLDWYEGDDSVNVTLKDLAGNEILQTTLDDTNTLNETQTEIVKKLNYNYLPHAGVYQLSFEGNTDWLINYIKVNTNKIILTGSSLITSQATLYTHIHNTTELNFFIWSETGQQIAVLKSDKVTKLVQLDQNDLSREKLIAVEPGNYQLTLQGNQVIKNANFAFSESAYFDPYLYEITSDKFSKPSTVISNVNMAKSDSSSIASATLSITKLEQIGDDNSVQIALNNPLLNTEFKRGKSLIDSGYTQLSKNGGYEVWGKQNIDLGNKPLLSQISSLLPKNSSLLIDKKIDYPLDLIYNTEEPSDLVTSDGYVSYNSVALRGSHTFYVYLKNSFSAQIVKEDINNYVGEDKVDLILSDAKGNPICKDTIQDDGNISNDRRRSTQTKEFKCGELKPGVYVFSIQEVVPPDSQTRSDFIVRDLNLNTNKFVFKDNILNVDPIVLYSNNLKPSNAQFTYWLEDKDQNIQIVGNKSIEVELSKDDLNAAKTYILPIGDNLVTIPKGYVRIRGNNFTLSKVNWFQVFKFVLDSSLTSSPDYVIYADGYPAPSVLRSISLRSDE